MNERDFVYWLQGYLEISETKELDAKQLQIVKDHLKLVFDKQTPDRSTVVLPRLDSLTAVC